MAAGDTYSVAGASVANNASMTLQPSGSTEARVETIECAAAASLYRYVDGTNDILLDSAPGQNTWKFSPGIKVTNTFYLYAKNTSGASQYMAASGVYTK